MSHPIARSIVLASLLAVTAGMSFASAQSVSENSISTAGAMSLGEIEQRLVAQGLRITEIEIKDLLVEVEGYDAQGRKVKQVLDRRSGEVLSQKIKIPKSSQSGR
jgi:hypothetical protein